MDRLKLLFERVAEGEWTNSERILKRIEASGIKASDFRLQTPMKKLVMHGQRPIGLDDFKEIVKDELLMVNRAFRKQMTIPDWEEFSLDIQTVFNHVSTNREGNNADYIPILKNADPEKWGLAICTVDGQRLGLGDVDHYHSIQSVSKPITYAYALEKEGMEFTHQHVGVEPSGRPFNSLDLLPDKRPFNPCVNAGAIMTAGLVASSFPERNANQITEEMMAIWAALSGQEAPVKFSEETMLSERETADNN